MFLHLKDNRYCHKYKTSQHTIPTINTRPLRLTNKDCHSLLRIVKKFKNFYVSFSVLIFYQQSPVWGNIRLTSYIYFIQCTRTLSLISYNWNKDCLNAFKSCELIEQLCDIVRYAYVQWSQLVKSFIVLLSNCMHRLIKLGVNFSE